jgi:hypothetical protein
MIILRKIEEAGDRVIRKMALDLFGFLARQNLPPADEVVARQCYAKNYYNNLAEFLQLVGKYTRSYSNSIKQDERKYSANYYSSIYDDIARKLEGVMLKLPL